MFQAEFKKFSLFFREFVCLDSCNIFIGCKVTSVVIDIVIEGTDASHYEKCFIPVFRFDDDFFFSTIFQGFHTKILFHFFTSFSFDFFYSFHDDDIDFISWDETIAIFILCKGFGDSDFRTSNGFVAIE